MRLAKSVFLLTLTLLMMSLVISAQTAPRGARSEDDPRNIAPTVGTGGAVGGPTGLFTVYDGQTLRRGEYTFSIAYSNFDRDPGNVDITEVPISFQIGLNNYIELFLNTDAWRGVKVNSPRNLSGFYLPNSQFALQNQNGTVTFQSAPAIVLAPGSGVGGIFRPQGSQPFVAFPFVGGSAGGFGVVRPGVGIFGFPLGAATTIGTARPGGGADLFPGIGSPVGGILPGIVLQTTPLTGQAAFGIPNNGTLTAPTVFTIAPSYLPDAPFINHQYGTSSFNTLTFGGKFRFTGPDSPVGIGLIPFYRWYLDTPDRGGEFNMLQRGASAGAGRGDFGLIAFADARLAKWANLSGNIGYTYNSSVKSNDAVLLDRGDELTGAIGVDFPVNRYFQLIGEARATKYVGGRTPNAFEQDPIDLLGGVRIFPARWWGMSFWYRYNVNQQDREVFDDFSVTNTVTVPGVPAQTRTITTTGVPSGFLTSTDPHGFGVQLFAGRRNARIKPVQNQFPTINSVTISDTEVTLPCAPGTSSTSGRCNDSTSLTVATNATDPENDPLVYQYTVSGGTIQGTGANVTWDVSGLRPGTYTLSVAVDDGCGVCGQPRQETIRVVECPDCEAPKPPTPVCPTGLDVSVSPNVINEGETTTFTATINSEGQSVSYNWSVSSGEIESGQGTPTITVRATPGTAGSSITATVNATTGVPECNASDSATVDVARKPTPTEIDRYGTLNRNAEKARLDNVAVTAQNDPNARILIIVTGRNNAAIRARANFAKNYLVNTRGIDPGRIETRSNGTGTAETVIWLVPAGADDPAPTATPIP